MRNDKTLDKRVTVELVRTTEGFSALEHVWQKLLAASPADTIFLRWDWLMEWWKAYGTPEMSLCILVVRKGATVIGIAPLYTERRPSEFLSRRHLMFLGATDNSLASEYLDFIYASGESGTVIRAAIEYAVGEKLCDDMYFKKMVSSSLSVEELRKTAQEMGLLYRARKDSVSPYLSLRGNFDEFLRGCGKSLRQNIRSGRRKLERFERFEIRRTSGEEELDADIDELVRLHQMRWKTRNQPGAFADERFFKFQRAVMKQALGNGHLELLFLNVNGRNIAALYNLHYRDKVYFYQSGIDASFSKSISPGLLLHSYSIEQAIKKGLKEYDFMLQGETDAYKYRWTNEQRHLCDIYMTASSINKILTIAKETIKDCFNTGTR